MAAIKHHITAFNSGELSETMASRFGVEKLPTGCRRLENFLPHIHGPVVKRPGMEFMGYADHATDGPRLLEFNYSATTRFCIEFADGEFIIWNPDTGAKVTTDATVAHPYSYAEAWEVQARQVNDVVYLVHPNHHPRKLTRRTATNWTCEEIDWKFPPLGDENFDDGKAADPVINKVWQSQLAMAEEFTVPALNEVPIPWAEISRSGANDTAWFELQRFIAGDAVTLTLEVLNGSGDWVVTGTMPGFGFNTRCQICFQPSGTVTSLRTRIRYFSGGSWGSWSDLNIIASFLPSGSTAANMPNITARVRMVFPGTQLELLPNSWVGFYALTSAFGPMAELPIYTTSPNYRKLPIGYWSSGTVSPVVSVAYTAPSQPPTLPNKTVALQIWNGTTWGTVATYNYNTSLTEVLIVMNEDDTLKVMEGATTLYSVASSEAGPWRMRMLSTYESFANVKAVITFDDGYFDDIHGTTSAASIDYEFGRSPSASTDPYTGGVTIDANDDYQVVIRINDAEDIPAGAKVTLQRKTSGSTWGKIAEQSLTTGQEGLDIVIPGKIYTTDTIVRAIYSSTSGEAVDGQMWIETITFPTPTVVTLQLSATSGSGRTLTASAATFQAGHVGSFWQVAHRRDLAFAEIVGVVGKFPSNKLTSKAIRVIGKWDFWTYGTWRGKVHLERRVSGDLWETVRVWSSNKDRNVIATGETETEEWLRVRAEGVTGFAASGADVPRFLLEAADARVYGIVKVTAFTSSTSVTVDVIRPAHSTDATKYWAEGAFSDVRGYPSCIGIHDGRMWLASTEAKPSTLWASVANDFENFRTSTLDDASFTVPLAVETGAQIRWLSSTDDAILIGTSGEEWLIRSNVEGQPMTPTNLRAGRRGAYSSAFLPARVTQDATLFVQRNRRKIRQASYSGTEGNFVASDMTVLAPHITESGIVQYAIQASPQTVIWCVLANGTLASMTYEREQNVFAWATHETDGEVKSLAILAGETSDQVWLSVERNGRACIERFDPKATEQDATVWKQWIYCDSAKRFGAGSSFSVPHLASRNVVGMKDGVPFSATVSAGGTLTLSPAATANVTVGLPFTSLIQPTRVELQMQDGTAQARRFKVARVALRLINSASVRVADDPAGIFEVYPLASGVLTTSMEEVAITASTREDVNVTVKDSTACPLTIGAMVLKMDVYGD